LQIIIKTINFALPIPIYPVTYLFYKLEKKYSALLYSVNHPHTFPELSDDFYAEIDLVKKQLKELYFYNCPQKTFENFVELHHSSLLQMLDSHSNHLDIERTKARLESAPDTDKLINLLQIYRHLNELLEFFHTLFGKFLCKQQLIPKEVLSSHVTEVKRFQTILEENIPQDISKEIKAQLMKPFSQFISNRPKSTWHNLFYCKELFQELSQSIEADPGMSTEDLIWLLFGMNYNSKSFYNTITNYIQALEPENYLECLYHFLKKSRQTIIEPQIAYNPANPNLNKMLEKWLKEEISFIKNTAQLKLPLHTQGLPQETDKSNPLTDQNANEKTSQAVKIFTALSVAELAYTVKLLVDAKLVKVNNHKQLFRSLANSCRTQKSENISAESLRSKFYKPEPGTQNMVKNRLIELINEIRKKPANSY